MKIIIEKDEICPAHKTTHFTEAPGIVVSNYTDRNVFVTIAVNRRANNGRRTLCKVRRQGDEYRIEHDRRK